MTTLRQNKDFGFYEVYPKPSPEELKAHYQNKYFSGTTNSYRSEYTPEELEHKRIAGMEFCYMTQESYGESFLDVGCGEGFMMAYMQEQGISVTGIDYTLEGVDRWNYGLKGSVIVGDILEVLEGYGKKYDLVNCSNLLEHVIDPQGLVRMLWKAMNPGAWLRVVVPYDASLIQKLAVMDGYAEPDYWVITPDHLNYFDRISLGNILSVFAEVELLADYPVDVAILNEHSNYEKDKSKGKAAHMARIRIENEIVRSSGIQPLIKFRSACADAGIGRNLIAYARKAI